MYKIGSSVDVHAFEKDFENGCLRLGGVEFKDCPKLKGHSDGDVVVHSLTESILLALNLGDLGEVFGVDKPETEGKNSLEFLEFAVKKMNEQGYEVSNATVQIIGKRPKIAPRRDEISKLLSKVVKGEVTVGSTTSDSTLLEIGNGEALIASSSVLLKKTS